MKRIFSHFLAVMLIAGPMTVSGAQSEVVQEPKVVVEHYKHLGDVPKAKRVRVINPYGSITSRSSTYDNVEVAGVIQKIGPNATEHQIDISDNDGVTEIVVHYPQGIRDDQGKLTGRFDIGIWLPSYIKLEMETDFGDIKVKKSGSDIVAKSNSGKISIATSGKAVGHSNSGQVHIDMKEAKAIQLPTNLLRKIQASQQKTTTTSIKADGQSSAPNNK